GFAHREGSNSTRQARRPSAAGVRLTWARCKFFRGRGPDRTRGRSRRRPGVEHVYCRQQTRGARPRSAHNGGQRSMTPCRLVEAAVVALLVLVAASGAVAGPATDRLKPEIDRVIATLESPNFRGDAKAAERRQAIRMITDNVFDWTEMSRRALARH